MYDFSDELRIQFKNDPKKEYSDYMTIVDEYIPAWQPAPYQRHDVAGGAALADQEVGSPRQVEDRRTGKVYSIPHNKYVRGLDRNGFIHPVIVSTIRPGPGKENGDDLEGTEHRVRGEKQMENGWLWMEPGESFRGLAGKEYMAWCFAVQAERKKAYEKTQEDQAKNFKSQALAVLEEQAKSQVAMTADMVKQIAAGLIEAMAAANKAK